MLASDVSRDKKIKREREKEELTDSFIKLLAIKLDPVNFRQLSQWHITRFMGSPVTSYWMPPQRQLPVMTSGVAGADEVEVVRSMVVARG